MTAITGLFLGIIYPWEIWWVLFLVFLSHFVIDSIKCLGARNGVYVFILDQFTHGVVLAIIADRFAYLAKLCIWVEYIPGYLSGLLILIGLVLCVWFGSALIVKSLTPITKELEGALSQGLENGGKWIGQLERALIYLLILSENPGTIGFLFAAKSILRFGEIKESGQRKEAEYIIIGTLMSFGWALLIATLIQRCIDTF